MDPLISEKENVNMKKTLILVSWIMVIFVLPYTAYAKQGVNLAYNEIEYAHGGGGFTVDESGVLQNSKYNYIINIPDFVYLEPRTNYEDFSPDSVTLIDKDHKFTYTISCDRFDDLTIMSMRSILNDYVSDDQQIFQNIVDYSKSHFYAMQNLYQTEFLFGEAASGSYEKNMKIFADTTEIIYSQPSNVIVYNTSKNNQDSIFEETHIMLIVPFPNNMSLYTININGEKGFLNRENLDKISKLIGALKIENTKNVHDSLELLSDDEIVNTINLGIYPPLDKIKPAYIEYKNQRQNYSIHYPSVFVPYLQNNIISHLDYASFKIDHNNYFSVSVKHMQSPDTCLEEEISLIKQTFSNDSTIIEEGSITLSNREFYYIKHQRGTKYKQSYHIVNDSKLYSIELDSKTAQIPKETVNEFLKVVKSIKFTEPVKITQTTNIGFSKYLDNYEGYSFLYPDDWVLTDVSTNVDFNKLSIANPNYSGSVETYISESECSGQSSLESFLDLLLSGESKDLDKYARGYYSPYSHNGSKVLTVSHKYDGDYVKVYRLINYLDDNNRHKFGYAIDIIRDKRIYSLFISVSDYLSTNYTSLDAGFDYTLNCIAESFTLEKTDEYLKRQASGDMRNGKIIFLENYFKVVLGRSATITYARLLTKTKVCWHTLIIVKMKVHIK